MPQTPPLPVLLGRGLMVTTGTQGGTRIGLGTMVLPFMPTVVTVVPVVYIKVGLTLAVVVVVAALLTLLPRP